MLHIYSHCKNFFLQVPGRGGYGPGQPMAPQMGGGPRMPPHPGMHPPQMHHNYPPGPPQGKTLKLLFSTANTTCSISVFETASTTINFLPSPII